MTWLERPWFVKICGVTSPGDAGVVAASGASALGVILTASRRRVALAECAAILAAAGADVLRVAVVRADDDPGLLDGLVAAGFGAVQVHGAVTPAQRRRWRDAGLGLIAALSVSDPATTAFDDADVDAVLLDGPRPGSGEEHGWEVLSARRFLAPVIAAGGLTPENVAALVERLPVWGVDVATGVEEAPGVKDPARVLDFVEAATRGFAAREVT